MANTDLQPELEEVLQEEVIRPIYEGTPTAVAVCGPVRVQKLPAKSGQTKTVTVGTTPVRVLQGDHRRAYANLLAIGGNMLFAFNLASSGDPLRMCLWPANTMYPHLGDDEIWVAAVTGTITVSVATGRWAVGEDGGS